MQRCWLVEIYRQQHHTIIFVFIIKASIKKVLGTSGSTDLTKINKCLQWCKKKIRTYRVEERRKVYLKLKVVIYYTTLKPGAGNKST